MFCLWCIWDPYTSPWVVTTAPDTRHLRMCFTMAPYTPLLTVCITMGPCARITNSMVCLTVASCCLFTS